MRETIKLDDLAVFLEVASLGSMTRVAERMDLPKSTISRIIRRLESQVGVRLLERTTRHLRLSADGEHLLEQTRPLVERLHETLLHSANQGETPKGVLRISTPYEFGVMRLGDVINRMLTQYPSLEIDCDLSSHHSDPRVQNYDIVFRMQVGDLPDSEQVARRVYTVNRGLFASPVLLAKTGIPRNLAELAAMPCLSSPEEPVWRLSDPEGHIQELEPLSRLRSPNVGMRLQGVLAGVGVGLLSVNFCRKELKAGKIVKLLPDWQPEPGLIYALLASRRLMPAKVRLFLDMLEESMNEPRPEVVSRL